MLAEEAVTDLLQIALDGHSSERGASLSCYGPPRLQVLQLRAFPAAARRRVVGGGGIFTRYLRVPPGSRAFAATWFTNAPSHELKRQSETWRCSQRRWRARTSRLGAAAGGSRSTRGRSVVADGRRLARPRPANRGARTASRGAGSRTPPRVRRASISCKPRRTRHRLPVRVAPDPPDVEVVCDAARAAAECAGEPA